jgi:hypothetical protein
MRPMSPLSFAPAAMPAAGLSFTTADGRPSSAVAKRETRKVNGLTAVIETPKSPYFVKLTGPEKTVTKWDRAYNQFVSSFTLQ